MLSKGSSPRHPKSFCLLCLPVAGSRSRGCGPVLLTLAPSLWRWPSAYTPAFEFWALNVLLFRRCFASPTHAGKRGAHTPNS